MKKYFFILALFLIQFSSIQAKLVSYPNSWTIMQKNDQLMNQLIVHYSPTAFYSLGGGYEYMREPSGNLVTINFNYLAKRWNAEESQGNLYFFTAAGVAFTSDKTSPAAYVGIASDWETQRIYFAYENRFLYAGSIEKDIFQRARIGFAPYVGNYTNVHTWLMFQVDYNTSSKQKLILTPLIRFFWDNKLIEIGYTSNKNILFNWIIRW